MSNYLSGMFNSARQAGTRAMPFLSSMFNSASPYLAQAGATAAPLIGAAIGNRFGNAQLGHQFGQMASQGLNAMGGQQSYGQAGANIGQMAGQMAGQYAPRLMQGALNKIAGTPMNQMGQMGGQYGGQQLDQAFGGMIPQQFQNSSFNTLGRDLGNYGANSMPSWMQQYGGQETFQGLGNMAQQGINAGMNRYGMPQQLQSAPFNQFGSAAGGYAGQQFDRMASPYMSQQMQGSRLGAMPRAAGGYLGSMYDQQRDEMPAYGMSGNYSGLYS